jgi:predicted nuclease of predicted toxin-antitoxin system
VRVWLDVHLSPAIATWLAEKFGIEAICIRDLDMRTAEDEDVFLAARAADALLMTKDRDFVDLVERLGVPPQILWVTCGNTSNARMREILAVAWPAAVELLEQGEPLVEITDLPVKLN